MLCQVVGGVTRVMQVMTDMRITLTPCTKQGSGKERVLAGEYVAQFPDGTFGVDPYGTDLRAGDTLVENQHE